MALAWLFITSVGVGSNEIVTESAKGNGRISMLLDISEIEFL